MRLREETKKKLEEISDEISLFLKRQDLDMVTAVDILGRAKNAILEATTSRWTGFMDQMDKVDEIYSHARKTAERIVEETLKVGKIRKEDDQFAGKRTYVSILPVGSWTFMDGKTGTAKVVEYELPAILRQLYLDIDDFSPDENGHPKLDLRKERVEGWIASLTDFFQNEMEKYVEEHPGEEISWEFPPEGK